MFVNNQSDAASVIATAPAEMLLPHANTHWTPEPMPPKIPGRRPDTLLALHPPLEHLPPLWLLAAGQHTPLAVAENLLIQRLHFRGAE